MGYNSTINKTRLGDQGAIRALLEVGIGRGMGGDSAEDVLDAKCAEACCFALATLLLNRLNQQIMKELNAMEALVQLVEDTDSMEVLRAGAMVVASLVPPPAAKKRLLCEGRTVPVEDAGGREALVRCRQWVYGRKEPPGWLLTALATCAVTEDQALGEQRGREEAAKKAASEDLFMDTRAVDSGAASDDFQGEFYDHLDLFREAVAEVKPGERRGRKQRGKKRERFPAPPLF